MNLRTRGEGVKKSEIFADVINGSPPPALRCNGSSEEGPELFDTRAVTDHAVAEVLKAAADTPIYYETPTTIAGKHYVDVSVGCHSPLGLALPRMRHLRAGDRANRESFDSVHHRNRLFKNDL